MAVNDAYKIEIRATHYSSEYVFTAFFKQQTEINHTQEQRYDYFWNNWRFRLGKVTNSQLIFTRQVMWQHGTNLAPYEKALAPVAGEMGGPSVPHQCQMVYTLRSATAGKRGRGRIYIPAQITQHIDSSGRWNNTGVQWHQGNLVNWFILFCSDDATTIYRWCVFSRADNVLRGITRVDIQPVIKTQRKRNIGYGA